MSDNEGPGIPGGSVRSVMSIGVLAVAAGLAAVLLIREPGSDLTQMVIGGWIAALGNVTGFYFGSRSGGGT